MEPHQCRMGPERRPLPPRAGEDGLHIDGGGTLGTRLGYTAMKLFGVDATEWGTQSNLTSEEVGEMLASAWMNGA
jgi:hypothetical protein